VIRRLFGPTKEELHRQLEVEALIRESRAFLAKMEQALTLFAMQGSSKTGNPMAMLGSVLGGVLSSHGPSPKSE
jgi:hypothetical protein